MYFFNEFTLGILKKYENHLELIDSIPVGFTGVASQVQAPIYSNEVDADSLVFAMGVDWAAPTSSAANVLVRIRSISPQYEWMANNQAIPQLTPISAVAGFADQVMPVLPLVMPFFLKANGRMEFRFTNASASAITGGVITLRKLKLTLPIDGGWNYGQGL